MNILVVSETPQSNYFKIVNNIIHSFFKITTISIPNIMHKLIDEIDEFASLMLSTRNNK